MSGAYLHWDGQWRAGAQSWSVPEPSVAQVVGLACGRAAGSRQGAALDLGCGIGRHALLMARSGLRTHAVDRSEAGLRRLRDQSQADGLAVHLCAADFRQIPFRPGTFDYVLAWNVIYHGTEQECAEALTRIRRIICPGGLFQVTMLSKRNSEYGRGVEIGHNAFVQPDAADDKVHPHVYSGEDDIRRLFAGFRILSMDDREQFAPGSSHWHLLCEAPGSVHPADQ